MIYGFIIFFYFLGWFFSYILYLNSSFLFFINIFIFNLIFYVSYIIFWFIFFMYLILFFIFYLSFKKIYSYYKCLFLNVFYIYIYISLVFISISDDFVIFICFFEGLLFPVFFCSFFFSFSNRFLFSIYYLLFFGAISSILGMLISFILIFHFNLLDLTLINDICFFDNYFLLLIIYIFIFIFFSIKYPLWPFHIWLPELHVEVSTEVSVILASLVLKMGFFGFYKFLFNIFNFISIWFISVLNMLVILGIFFLSLGLLFICDYKKIIAFWSVIHTGMGVFLMWNNDYLYVSTFIFCNLGHVLSSGIMFSLIGFMYDFYGVRIFILLIGFFGVSIWSNLFIFAVLLNIDFPFMLLFYVDLIILHGIINISYFFIFFFIFYNLILFISSFYIYVNLSFYSFVWNNKFLRLDLTLNDIFLYYILCIILLLLYFFIYYLF